VLFRQTRCGRYGRPFTMFKFRTMRVGVSDQVHRAYVHALIEGKAAPNGANGRPQVFKLVGDDRVTRVGRFLRASSLDELPNLLNVLGGTMSLVGPRPPLPYEVERYKRDHVGRLRVKPGMTGLWQVNGRNALSFEEMVRLDLEYVARQSFWLDLAILLRTPLALIRSRGS
jgi:lipopolysaccharide/colanic/teichoic acid biosynthesis glycosyltransferase